MSEVYAFIEAEKTTHHVALLCRLLKVARSSFYAWLAGEKTRSARKAADDALAHEITVLHLASRGVYGVPRIHAGLRRLGHRVNRKRIERVMRERGISGVTRRKRRSLTRPAKRAVPAPDLLGRDFTASAPGMKLVGSGSQREFHPPAPTEPCVTVSRYTALVTLITRNYGTGANARTFPGTAV
ncbi:IS3 family transposase [Streptomyces sp. ME02-8801-2C]|uniref:IS3 family transposase n=1 Tax=Streptomyces sp. ME02-8801-2C TaxID=3028680 RepID=UPI0029AB7770|nr:IS3 family transposase [Streptomyces sp. ME02-8801-2C]MDX3458789.1 IS3 family transposase [Streptomyces sp. ME02-8801-2C]